MIVDTIVNILKYAFSYDLLILVIALIAIWIGKLVNDLVTPKYKTDEEITGKKNIAFGIALAGYCIGLAIAIAGVVVEPEKDTLWNDLVNIGIYSFIAIILMNISMFIHNKIILYKFDIKKELVEDQNVGTGAIMAGAYIATGLIINASISGEVTGGWWKGLLACVVFYVLGQIVLILAGLWYQLITKYDDRKVIQEENNAAAGISFGGFLFAVGYIASNAMIGESQSWGIDLVSFALYVIIAIIFLTLGYWVTDKVFLPKVKISEEIGTKANIAVSAITVAVNFAVAVLIVHVL